MAAQSQQQQQAAEIKQLKAQVADLQTRQLKEDPAEQAAMMQAVLSDADQHSKFFDEDGITAGHANGRFFIRSDDGNFLFQPWIHIQIRDTTNYRQDINDGGTSSNTQNGFELRRARFGFDGNIFTPDLTYFINWATYRGNSTLTVGSTKTGAAIGTTTSPIGGEPVLEEAWIKYHFPGTPYYVHIGQIHDPLDHENMVGSKYRAPEASLQGDIFGNTDTFTQAATFIYDPKQQVRFEGGVTDGIRAANTNFEDYPNNGIAYDWGVAGRVEYKVFGNWHDYDQLAPYGDQQNLLVFGSGYDYSEAGKGDAQFSHTFDVQYATTQGWFVYACYFGRYTRDNQGIPNGGPVSTSFGTPGVAGKDTYEPSVDILLAQDFNNLEPFVRYEYLYLQGTPAGSQNNVTDISVGANYYFYGHNFMFTGMVTYLPNGIPISDDGADIEADNGRGEVIFLTQLQLLL
ncbi:MAG TPA: hypothetical protein VMD30_01865 [Tepidisphaeraceae bacterium]|nr:hypothetical protein [Tepidisphaeraceae bacterium]